VSNLEVALASTLLTALYPVFFAQSSLAHLDMMAAAFTLWGLSSYLQGHRWRAVAWFAVAGLSKETALIAPAVLLGWEFLCLVFVRRKAACYLPDRTVGRLGFSNTLALAASVLPLAGWLAFHYTRTGVVLGNPEYFRYNVGATLHPLRVALALAERLWQLFAYLNMFVLTGVTVLALRQTSLTSPGAPREQRPGLPLVVQSVFAAVIAGYLSVLSFVGGAVLARYLLPVYPLVIIASVAVLWRSVPWWKVAVAAVSVAFLAGLFIYPPYRIAPEDNLAYADYVKLHKDAEIALSLAPHARVLTAWPATDELQRPYLGYVPQPVRVVPVENFSAAQLHYAAQRLPGQFDYAFVFSTKYEPPHQLRGWWEGVQTRYFDYHRDLPPETAAAILGGKIVYRAQRGGEWVAIIALPANSEFSQSFFSRSGREKTNKVAVF
jgi:hypothetical protein